MTRPATGLVAGCWTPVYAACLALRPGHAAPAVITGVINGQLSTVSFIRD